MLRFVSVFILLLITVVLAVSLTGCLGSSTPNSGTGGVRTISLNPGGNISMETGSNQVFSASALDGSGHAIIGASIQFVVNGPPGSIVPPPLSMTSSGNACAGTWDVTQTLCTPGNSGVAIITAVANGASSPQTTVYVHEHIDSLRVSQAQTLPPTYDCFSQGQTWVYQAVAYHNGADISNTVGPLTWSSSNLGVLTTNTNPAISPPLTPNQVQITAASPGITTLFASVSGTTSNSLPITTCLVRYVRLQASGSTASQVSVNNGTSVPLLATAVDTLGFTLARPPLTWTTSEPEVVSFGTASNATGSNSATAHNNLGGGTVTASCIPPTCNIGVQQAFPVSSAMPDYVFASDGPISSTNPLPGYGAISIDVTTNSTLPIFTGWAATNGCDPSDSGVTNGCTSTMFSITPNTSGSNPIVSMVTLPRTPNSMLFNHQARIYLGSAQGLMYADAGGSSTTATLVSGASTPCNVALCGKVLTISNDGRQVVVFDGSVAATPQIYLFNSSGSGGTVTDVVLPANTVVTAAAFSPDQSKIFILTNTNTMYVYSTLNPTAPVSIGTPGTAAAFSADGSFAYVGGSNGSVSAFSMCASPTAAAIQLGSGVSTPSAPLEVFPSPMLQHGTQGGFDVISQTIYLLEPPNIQFATAAFTQQPPPVTQPGTPLQYFCNPPLLTSFTLGPTYNLRQGQFIPVYSRMVNNGAQIIVVARHIPAVLIFSTNDGTTTAVPLVNGGVDPLSASSSSDGSTVYVAACDQYESDGLTCAAGSAHVVNTLNGSDLQVPFINNTTNNMCNGQGTGAPVCFPTMVAIKPQ